MIWAVNRYVHTYRLMDRPLASTHLWAAPWIRLCRASHYSIIKIIRQLDNSNSIWLYLFYRRESTILDFSSQNCRRILWYTLYVWTYIVIARDRGSKATNTISTITPSKISFPSPENFLSDRAKHQARQSHCATKNKNPTSGFFPHSLSLKWDWLYSFERSTLFTTTLLKGVLFSLPVFRKEYSFFRQIFWKTYSYSFH